MNQLTSSHHVNIESLKIRHSHMRLAAIQANLGLDSRLKRSRRQTGEKSSEVHLTARCGGDSIHSTGGSGNGFLANRLLYRIIKGLIIKPLTIRCV